ncbi:hypothetical protein [Legionella micdadei]|uniref:Uncharacterized protein n=2 Tax=Legionella micdadei TaxID=451 RepID=A0A098GCX4_LEGMI|nr:hypothetical protein [Legionella micdadei]ARG98457.1 hypothetical protein B6N58_12755 [Legionella micdadei]KTD30333.1 hypothetical protein Lmic_0084 [Legionella micdadei]NSL18391.1 hypothetical protein [Legionella micdadei]CEG59855.1 membrane protein of unknown function [Legionella micdadei]SCY52148.1 hypothetical protein SAMN02982997_01947 [Legionella micdadei]
MKHECLSTVFYFLILLFLSRLIRHFYKKEPHTSTSDGSIVMAIGIFSFDALQQLSFCTHKFSQVVTLELLIIWLYLASSYINQYLQGSFNVTIKCKVSQFGIGTWVAGSSILAMLIFRDFSCYHFVAWMCAFLAFIIWLIYLILAVSNLWLIVVRQSTVHIGIILLATVSTQSIALLTYFLFATSIGFFAYQMLIVLGYLFYLTGLFIIGRYLLQIQWKRIVLGWNSTNSIIHGALSISGLAAATTEIMPEEIIIGTWFLATVFLLLVEGISVIKGLYRLRIAGFTQGILVYDVSQWARVFTFGMYYTFNLSLIGHHVYTNCFIKEITHYGQYGVAVILLFELVNYFNHVMKARG